MKTTCPHCSQSISIDTETFASLQGTSHFECPACAGAVAVPLVQGSQQVAPLRIPDGEATGLSKPLIHTDRTTPLASHKGMNRNLLILGSVALLVLGGLAAFIASRKEGNVHNTRQNIRNEIINNSYFQDLITSGVTTEKDLNAITDIRPHGDGFIGISVELMAWNQARDLAMRTGAEILPTGDPAEASRSGLVKWLTGTFKSHISPSAWMRERDEPRVLIGSEILTAMESNGMRRALLHWQTSRKTHALLAGATKDRPFVSKLGMKFVPVPGTGVLMCVHETRRQDYAAYAADSSEAVHPGWAGDKFNGIPSGNEDDHPVCFVNLEDALGFCDWLSKKEGITFRLPSDQEWSHAVGIGHLEKRGANTNPSNLHATVPNVYPWGETFPPRMEERAGNYADLSLKQRLPNEPVVPGYRDGFATTAPVMSFSANNLGIHDLGGNVWEWCNDRFKAADGSLMATLRGAAYNNDDEPDYLLSSCRFNWDPKTRTSLFGFRIVAELSADPAERQRILGLITSLGGTYALDTTLAGSTVSRVSLPMTKPQDADLRIIKRLSGVKIMDLNGCYQLTDEALAEIEEMKSLQTLILWGVHPITDEGFKYLSGFHDLEVLNIGYTGVETLTGSGLVHLQKLSRLRSLGLNVLNRLQDENLKYLQGLLDLEYLGLGYCLRISDKGVEEICRLPKLRELDLRDTQVTDEGLMKLKNLPSLRKVWIGGSRVTEDGVKRFQTAVPGVEMIR